MASELIPCDNKLGDGCPRKYRRTHGRQKYCELCRIDRNWYMKLSNESHAASAAPVESYHQPELGSHVLVEAVIPQEDETDEGLEPVVESQAVPRLTIDLKQPRVMVWVDFENIFSNLPDGRDAREAVSALIALARTAGRMSACKVYADWTKFPKESKSLGILGVELVQVSTKTNGRDRSDMAIAMDLMESGERYADVIVLASGDADFEDPIRRLMCHGKGVAIVASRDHTSNTLKTMVDQYVAFEDLMPEAPEPHAEKRTLSIARGETLNLDAPQDRIHLAEFYRLEAIVEEHMRWRRGNPSCDDVYLKAFRDRGLNSRMFADFREPDANDRHALMRDMTEAGIFTVVDTKHWTSGNPIRAVQICYDHPLVVESQQRLRAG